MPLVIGRGQEGTPRTTDHGLVFASGSEPRSAGKEDKQCVAGACKPLRPLKWV